MAERMVDLIIKKRDGCELSREEIKSIIDGYVAGSVPDYQMSAFMMAVVFRGMTKRETAELTTAMMESGDVADLSSLPGIKVDKHSTGGVGDTTTLVIAPLVAACGGTVAKMSGRGLGHTGGTLDKLESVPGLSVAQPIERFLEIVRENGLCVIGQTGDLVPADKLMYALRDVTGTVQSIPLIASSIMSKKLAAGSNAIVLDVKMGSGAFVHTIEEARKLARTMVDIGSHMGRRVVAVITDMNQPLGTHVGNGLEMKEAIDLLSGRVDRNDPLYKVCMLLAENMLIISGLAETADEADRKLEHALTSGEGLARLRAMLAAMGGDTACIEHPELLCNVRKRVPVYPERAGRIEAMNAVDIGVAAQLLGAGRAKKSDVIDPAVGLVMHARLGDEVSMDRPVATLYVNDETHIDDAHDMLLSGIIIGNGDTEPRPMVYDVIR